MNKRLIVVSNRVSVPKSKTPTPGGLAVGVLAALQKSGGIWYGWNGKTTKRADEEHDLERLQTGNIEFVTSPLTTDEYEHYYKGYANRVLWPLFHSRLNLVEYQRKYLDIYRRTNQAFAKRVIKLCSSAEDLIWVHDYHCIPMGQKLRDLGAKNKIGFFLHIPFPAFDIFRAMPDHKFILQYFLAYDLVGFQSSLDRDSFLDSVSRIIPEATVMPDMIEYENRRIKAEVFPIGIDYENVRQEVQRAYRSTHVKRLQENLRERKLIIGVDRLDYSKGLAERFKAFQQLLTRFSQHREHTVFVQVAQPSRDDVPEYQAIRNEVDYLAGRINGRFAQYDRIPLRYLNRGFSRPTILGFLSLANVGLVTPLRDGMNLVAKEFVAAQNPDDPGALVLSRMTGAAEELEGALLVTPYNIDGVTETIDRALTMPLDERRDRWQRMMVSIRSNTITDWSNRFVTELDNCPGHRTYKH